KKKSRLFQEARPITHTTGPWSLFSRQSGHQWVIWSFAHLNLLPRPRRHRGGHLVLLYSNITNQPGQESEIECRAGAPDAGRPVMPALIDGNQHCPNRVPRVWRISSGAPAIEQQCNSATCPP